jgi:hypothetical protein
MSEEHGLCYASLVCDIHGMAGLFLQYVELANTIAILRPIGKYRCYLTVCG